MDLEASDLYAYHRLRFGARPMTRRSLLFVLLTSPAYWQIRIHHLMQALIALTDRHPKYRFAWRPALFAIGIIEIAAKIIVKNELTESTRLERGVYLSDRGGVILGARLVGSGSIIHHNTTIGLNPPNRGVPMIGKDVWIGPGSVISGPIAIGDGSVILPNTVLTKSVPPHTVMQGNPALVVARDVDSSMLRSCPNPDIDAFLHAVARPRQVRQA